MVHTWILYMGAQEWGVGGLDRYSLQLLCTNLFVLCWIIASSYTATFGGMLLRIIVEFQQIRVDFYTEVDFSLKT
jgi:hypothetical protein